MRAMLLLVAMTFVSTTAPSCAQRVDGRYARHADCDGLHDSCIGGGRCCSGMSCGYNYACCVSVDQVCDHSGDCCSGKCKDGVCARSGPEGACNSGDDCKSGLECSATLLACYALPGGYCRTSNDCGSNLCHDGTCACGQGEALCQSSSDCCANYVCNGGLCAGNGGTGCGADTDCNNGCCVDGACQSCGNPIGSGCTSDSDCGAGASCDPTTGTCL